MTSLGRWRRGWDGPWVGSDVWDPFGFGSTSMSQGERRDNITALAGAHVDWRENDNFHIFHVDIPGVRKEEVKVQVEDGNILQISGEKTKEEEHHSDKWHRVERWRGSFTRRFRLPENANPDEINCSLENGVLAILVPKKGTDQEARSNVRYCNHAPIQILRDLHQRLAMTTRIIRLSVLPRRER